MAKRNVKADQSDPEPPGAVRRHNDDLKVFISWSGDKSKIVATALKDFLTEMMEGITPWISTHDISAGTRWNPEIDKQLNSTNVGILCLAKDNLLSPWILFEAGALAKAVESSRVIPYRLKLSATDVQPPLSQFNSVAADREGTLSLLKSLNSACGERYEAHRIEKRFEKWWPDLEVKIGEAAMGDDEIVRLRPEREILEEVQEIARRQDFPYDEIYNGVSKTINELKYTVERFLYQRRQSFISHGYDIEVPDSGYDLVDYLGCLSLEQAKQMGDGSLCCYWRSLCEILADHQESDDHENAIIENIPLYEELHTQLRKELQARGLIRRQLPLKFRPSS